MRYSYWIVILPIILHLVGCGDVKKDSAEVSLSLFGATFQGESQDEVITNLIEQTDEFDYYDEEKTNIKRVIYCGIPFGLNIEAEQIEGMTIITKMTLITSHHNKADFKAIKDGITKRLGKPDIEEDEDGIENTDDEFYGRCVWQEGGAKLRNLNGGGGVVVFFATFPEMTTHFEDN